MKKLLAGFMLLLCCAACHQHDAPTPYQAEHVTKIETGKATPEQLIYFACSLGGKPYKFGSVNPDEGFDCSGFVTYVFNHFGISVPRTSADFTNVGPEVDIKQAKYGDLVLFTGGDSTKRVGGHIGIVSSLPGEPLRFIHASSGKHPGVVETAFYTPYYEARYLKTIRLFAQNNSK